MARPAGLSSEDEFSGSEEDSYFSFGDSPERKRRNRSVLKEAREEKKVELNKDEKLLSAVMEGDVEKARKLIEEEGADPNYKADVLNSWPPILHAASMANLQVFKGCNYQFKSHLSGSS